MEASPQQSSTCEEKLKCLLQLILTPSFTIQNDTLLNKLLSHLSNGENKVANQFLQSQVVISWIPTALSQWEAEKLANNCICSFVLNLTALLSQDETTFVTYSLGNVYERLFILFKMQNEGVQPTIKLAYLRILSSFLNHSSGLEWIMSNNIWRNCLNFCLDNETVYIIQEGHSFIYNLIVKTVVNHEDFCKLVVAEIYSKLEGVPVNESSLYQQLVVESGLEQKCTAALHLVIYILNQLIENENKKGDYRAVNILLADNILEERIKQLKSITNEVERVYELYAVLIYIKVFHLLVKGKETPYEDFYTTGVELMGFINELLCVRYIPVVIRLAHLSDSLWNHFPEARAGQPLLTASSEYNGREPLRFQNQLLLFEVTAIFGICFLHTNYRYDESDDLREDFIHSFFRMLHERTIRMGYSWRDILHQQTEGFKMAKFAAQHVLRSIDNFNKSRAITIFQVLLYTLKDIQIGLKEKPTLIELFIQHDSFMITLFQTMAAFINKYDITWRDSVETLCVMNNAIECINQSFWPARVVVHALKLVELSIAKFLPPDLALLVEEDSTTSMLGSMLTAKLYDRHWEIRDSTLEILHTIANISNSKYPLFQTMLLNVNIIPMIVTMTMHDSSGFVRATAIKCLQEMIQVQEIWSQLLVNQELPQKIMHILNYEPEAIVRTEAAKLMSKIHEFQSFQNDLMGEIYESMALAAAKDLHWEVKSNALDFWGKVVLNHMQEQGYIDNKFPSVTFSREKRKIVTLTEDEVQRRLTKVLDQLSEIGCLGVLIYAIHEDCDLEVSKKSLRKVKKMKNILQMHKMFDMYDNVPLPENLCSTNAKTSPAPQPHIDLSEATLDDILDTNDENLLKHMFTQEVSPLHSEQTRKVSEQLKEITPDIFITFIQNDLDAMINEKVMWLNKLDDFESLLDDMTKNYDGNVNTMDCY